MNEPGRRVNSIVVKNLPTNINQSQLEELFAKFGRIVSTKILPPNPTFDGCCGFVNYAEAESCDKAVENMNNYTIDRFTLRVSHASPRTGNNSTDRPQNGFSGNVDPNGRTLSATSSNHEENTNTPPSSSQHRFIGFRPASERTATQLKPMSSVSRPSSSNELDTPSNVNKPLWNSASGGQKPSSISKSPFQTDNAVQSVIDPQLDIREHESFLTNKIYSVYLSNLDVPNTVYAATLDDYVNATLLITQMNKHEQLDKVQLDSYKFKPSVGSPCAALFNGDWYRARILEVEENRVRVQYVDWGNTGWCNSILEIRPLPVEYYKDPVLCVRCILDGVSDQEKASDEQTNSILAILVLDTKIDMTVVRIENNVPYVQLNLGERNLNAEIRAIFPQLSKPQIQRDELIDFNAFKPDVNIAEVHHVQMTTVDAEPECFHVLLMRDDLPTIMNILKDWHANKQPLTKPPKPNMLVCAQYEGDDLWYRAWIQNATETGFRVYFVDFGNEEIVSIDRLSECPQSLQKISWQAIQIKLANIKLTDDERYLLLRDFETDRLEMKIIAKQKELYSVELVSPNGKSLTEHLLELRKKEQQQQIAPPITNGVADEHVEPVEQPPAKILPPPPPPTTTTATTAKNDPTPKGFNENPRAASLPVHPPVVEEIKRPIEPAPSKVSLPTTNTTSTTTTINQPPSTVNSVAKQLFPEKQQPQQQPSLIASNKNDDAMASMVAEQRRQTRLLEQILAAINTTNALLQQLVQR